jgi:hypothetical protein
VDTSVGFAIRYTDTKLDHETLGARETTVIASCLLEWMIAAVLSLALDLVRLLLSIFHTMFRIRPVIYCRHF